MQLKVGQEYCETKRIIEITARNVRRIRIEKKYSSKELACKTNKNIVEFYRFENQKYGTRKDGVRGGNIKLATLVALAMALEVPLMELFRQDAPESQINPEDDGC